MQETWPDITWEPWIWYHLWTVRIWDWKWSFSPPIWTPVPHSSHAGEEVQRWDPHLAPSWYQQGSPKECHSSWWTCLDQLAAYQAMQITPEHGSLWLCPRHIQVHNILKNIQFPALWARKCQDNQGYVCMCVYVLLPPQRVKQQSF